jgi:Na+-driven multidrug efflux pump
VAGYTIAIRVVVFALLPAYGLGNAAATMVGQNLGARNPERAERSVWTAARYNLGFLGAVGLLFAVLSPSITAAFSKDVQVASTAALGLRLIALGFPFYAFGMVLTQAFNGAGDTRTPTWINLFVFWLFEIPSAWLLSARFGMGPTGVFVAITASYSMLALVSAALFRRGRWREKVV